jgi:hypothetical protein
LPALCRLDRSPRAQSQTGPQSKARPAFTLGYSTLSIGARSEDASQNSPGNC